MNKIVQNKDNNEKFKIGDKADISWIIVNFIMLDS